MYQLRGRSSGIFLPGFCLAACTYAQGFKFSSRDLIKNRKIMVLVGEERIDFIRNQGDSRISIRIDIGNEGGAALGRERSQLAENVVKERINSFGRRRLRLRADEGEARRRRAGGLEVHARREDDLSGLQVAGLSLRAFRFSFSSSDIAAAAPPFAVGGQASKTFECRRRSDHHTDSAATGMAQAAVLSALNGQPIACAPFAR
jgi:hypothetical protein